MNRNLSTAELVVAFKTMIVRFTVKLPVLLRMFQVYFHHTHARRNRSSSIHLNASLNPL
jgi:hypothetical protein